MTEEEKVLEDREYLDREERSWRTGATDCTTYVPYHASHQFAYLHISNNVCIMYT